MKKDYTDITFIIDRSGSMETLAGDVIGSFNSFVDKQKNVKGKATLSLVQFNNKVEVSYTSISIQEIEPLNRLTYQPYGSTSLNDAVGETIKSTGERLSSMPECDRPDKVIIIIQTDGAENSSVVYKTDELHSMISEQKDKYSWEFIFMGSDISTYSTSMNMGIDKSKTILYDNSAVGTSFVFSKLSDNITSYRSHGSSINMGD